MIKNHSSKSIVRDWLSPNYTMISTLLGTQTKNKILFIKKRIHFQTNLPNSKPTDDEVKTIWDRERLSHGF